MKREPVNSSNIQSVGYDEASQTLEVEFKPTGKVYRYKEVPKTMADALVRSDSVGSFFARHIKSAFSGELVSE